MSTENPKAGPQEPDADQHGFSSAVYRTKKKMNLDWQMLAGRMCARKAYRRFHGTHQRSFTRETWQHVLIILILWGIYSIRFGNINSIEPTNCVSPSTPFSPAATDSVATDADAAGSPANTQPLATEIDEDVPLAGTSVTFIWAYTSAGYRITSLVIAIMYVGLVYLLIRYQHTLELQGSFWISVVGGLVLLALAIESAVESGSAASNVEARTGVVTLWTLGQILVLMVGVFKKRVLPWIHQSGRLFFLHLDAHRFYSGAYTGTSFIWSRFPDLRERLIQEYEGQHLFTFTGTYYYGFAYLLRYIGISRTYTTQYVGGLDRSGHPHGIGIWLDTAPHGEFLIGTWQHGMPVAPFRSRGNTGSGFVAFRIGVLTCRNDAVTSPGGTWAPTYKADTPLQSAIASVECCTSGLFYKGFPRTMWLQLPQPIVEKGDKVEGDKRRSTRRRVQATLSTIWSSGRGKGADASRRSGECSPSALSAAASTDEMPPVATAHSLRDVDQPPPATASFPLQSLSRWQEAAAAEACGSPAPGWAEEEAAVSINMNAAQPQPQGQGSIQRVEAGVAASQRQKVARSQYGIVPSRRWAMQEEGTVAATASNSDSDSDDSDGAAAPRCGCLPRSSRRSQKRDLWQPQGVKRLEGVTRLSPWLFSQNPSSLLADLGAMHRAEEQRGYEALLFVHGFNSALSDAVKLVAQLLALGKFPPHIMPVVFGWPCTTGIFYGAGRDHAKSGHVRTRFLAALEHLRADGCRKVHLFGHSMGARVVAALAPYIADLFPQCPAPRSEPRASSAPPPRYGPGVLEIESVTFLSPDLELSEFVAAVGPALRSVCPVVTVYGDTNDDALGWAAAWSNLLASFGSSGMPFKDVSSKMTMSPGMSLGRHCDTIVKLNGETLDIDFVVTTYLQSNVHNMRHNYFHLNREMVDDIREVVVTCHRASERSHRLELTGENVYGFLLAPSYVVAAS